jgi:alkanesulfonate monooxygenase
VQRLGPVQIYATCPQSRDVARDAYIQRVIDAAQWSEEAGCHGMLVYTDNGIADPWLVAQLLIQHTKALVPLVAVQPAYMSPFSAAKMVASLGWMHGRAVALNMVAGGFRNDLLALGDPTPHDERYERLIEYVAIIKALLADRGPVTMEGKHYRVRNLRGAPALPADLMPDVLVSGSSAAGEAAAQTMGAISVTYPEPVTDDSQPAPADGRVRGVRVGIIARETAEEAWDVAYERFPDTRSGRITHGLAMKVSDSQWHRQLSSLEERPATPEHPYWLGPFQTSATFCPYLVGTYERVGDELARYVGLGASVFILDIPPSREELVHTGVAIRRAKTSNTSTHAHASR